MAGGALEDGEYEVEEHHMVEEDDGNDDDGVDDGNNICHDEANKDNNDHRDDDGAVDEEDKGDTTDGGPPLLVTAQTKEEVVKRPHIQSKRMQEYQAMQQMTHNAGRVFECPEHRCRRIFNSAPGLRYHIKQTHRDSLESFTCDSCHKEFKSLNGLKYHRGKKCCQGQNKGTNFTTSNFCDQSSESLSTEGSRVTPHPLVLPARDECPAPRLLDLANIATGPQSPLLQSLGSSNVGTSFFDSPEKNAVIALSRMAQKRSSRSSTTEELDEPTDKCAVEHDPAMKSKRPMNGFMLFAQKNRAEFNKMFPHTNNRMISTKLSEEWTKLPEEERQKWKEDARQMAEVQRSKHPDCWKRKKYTKDRN